MPPVRYGVAELIANYIQPSILSVYPHEDISVYQPGFVSWTMPITTSSSGYAYLLLEAIVGVGGKICYYLNDNSTNATNVGSILNSAGPLGNYEFMYRWNFEI